MAMLGDVVRLLRKLSDQEEELIDLVSGAVSSDEKRYLVKLVKQKRARIRKEIVRSRLGDLTSVEIVSDIDLSDLNAKVNRKLRLDAFREFSSRAYDSLPEMIAPRIVGFENAKRAVASQLFSNERFHLLLLGDPGTGKTRLLQSAIDYSPVGTMGLGSGTTGVGLAITVKGKEVLPGLLPQADLGLCAIDELNLMKEESRASLYNAMESGFVSYNKGGNSVRFDARVCILATANPKGDSFKGSSIDELRKQLPFDPALLSRFHLVFLVRKPDLKRFKDIGRNILGKDKREVSEAEIEFIKEYVKFARDIKSVALPDKFKEEIVEFIGELKQDESNCLMEITPRMIVGFERMAKAFARMELREKVGEKDIATVKEIVNSCLKD